jgi:hypothetical protein
MLLSTIAITVGIVAVATPPAHALGTGRACIFNASSGAFGFGHVGWAYRVDQQDLWVFGSVENPGGSASVPPGQYNGAWSATGAWHEVLASFFGSQAPSNSSPDSPLVTVPHAANYYDGYTCEDVANSNVGAANAVVATLPGEGYGVFGNNCEDAANAVLSAYNATGLLPPSLYPAPNAWFQAIATEIGWTSPTALPTCDRQNCDNRDPVQTGCAANVTSVTQATWPTGTIELRWSTDCWTNWSRFTPSSSSGGVGVHIWVERESAANDGGIPAKVGGKYGFTIDTSVGPYWGNMLYSPGPARACFNVNTGPAHCTNWV